MATPKTFNMLGKCLCLAGVLAFLAGPAVTVVAMTKAFQQIDETGAASQTALEQRVALSFQISAISIPAALILLGAGGCCYVVAARLKCRAASQNGEFPAV